MLSLLILVIVFLAAYLIFIRTLFWVFLRRKNPAKRIEKNDEIKKKYQLDLDWLKNKKDQMLTVLSEDGLKLKGHFFDFGKKKTAILVHGYSNDWREMANYAKIFAKFDFNILIVEQRAHGKSQGLIITMGIEEGRDLICWARCLKEEKRQSQIILFGVSMGGTSVLFSVGEKENHNFDLAICDSAFSNIFQQVIHFGKSKFGKL